MYRHLNEALGLAKDERIRGRIMDMILYTRYAELYYTYSSAKGEARQNAYEDMLNYTWSISKTQMAHFKAVYAQVPISDKRIVQVPMSVFAKAKSPSEEEIKDILAAGIVANKLIEFTPKNFSKSLVPAAAALQLPEVKPSDERGQCSTRPAQIIYTWVEKAPAAIEISVLGKENYGDRGKLKIKLFAADTVKDNGDLEVAYDDSVPKDEKAHDITLKTTCAGLHWLQVEAGSDPVMITFKNPGMHFTVAAGIDKGTAYPFIKLDEYFYVPKGTNVVGGYAEFCDGSIMDGSGNEIFAFKSMAKPGYFSVAVPEGQDGKLWKFNGCRGQRLLMTVPPYLARNEKELLLPREVIEADAVTK